MPKSKSSSFWSKFPLWSKRTAMLLPILALAGILYPSIMPVIKLPDRVSVVEQRIDLQERIAIQREILKLREEARSRRLTDSEKNYLQDLSERLKELEKRK